MYIYILFIHKYIYIKTRYTHPWTYEVDLPDYEDVAGPPEAESASGTGTVRGYLGRSIAGVFCSILRGKKPKTSWVQTGF